MVPKLAITLKTVSSARAASECPWLPNGTYVLDSIWTPKQIFSDAF